MELGLIGRTLQHSFSRNYFEAKFARQGLSGYSYSNFELQEIGELPKLLETNPELQGLNVTIPYKEAVLAYLDKLSDEAQQVGAVNTIAIRNGKLFGFNTDVYGFRESLRPLLKPHHKNVLVLGTGGASRAVVYALRQLNLKAQLVSRKPQANILGYEEATTRLSEFQIVVNTTPLGTFPKIDEKPPLNTARVLENYLFYDLIYNPGETEFLREAKSRRASTKNGHEMLILQAEKAWEIWHNVQK